MGNYWESFSLKAGSRVVRLYSDLAYDHWVLLEADPTVVSLCEEPIRIQMPVGDKWVGSILDMWYATRDGEEYFCEVKYARDIKSAAPDSRIGRQLAAQLAWAKGVGARYCIATDLTVRSRPKFLVNWKSALRYLAQNRAVRTEALQEAIREQVVRCRRGTTIGALASRFPAIDSSVFRTALFREIHAGRLLGDMNGPLLSELTQINHHHE
jgi:hypothetical protein